MDKKLLYQTLENRDNQEEIHKNGPFDCNWSNAWLGEGYYFWDTFIQSAHWWGKIHYSNNHIICEAECEISEINCFDLVGNTNHLIFFNDFFDNCEKANLITDKTTVATILEHMKYNLQTFNFEVIRAYGINTISDTARKSKKFSKRINFDIETDHYFDARPAIQICIFQKFGLNLKNYHIVFPDEYNFQYVV